MIDAAGYETYFNYGTENKVVFEREEVKKMKDCCEKGLILMGFKPKDRIKEYQNLKPAYFVYPDEASITGSTTAFIALLKAMSDSDKVAICRLKYRPNVGTMMVALWPVMDPPGTEEPRQPGMYCIWLPWSDDIRDCPKQPGALAEEEMVTYASILMQENCDKVGEKVDFETLEWTDPNKMRFYDILQAKALEEAFPEERDDTWNAGFEGMWQDLEVYASALFEKLPDAPPDKPAKKRKSAGAKKGGAAKKKVKAEADDDINWQQACIDGSVKKYKVTQIKSFLGSAGLSKSGKKAELIERVKAHFGIDS